MTDNFLLFRSSRIHYTFQGKGSRLLFAFHGYGESAASFSFLSAALGPAFTIVSIDLPFHGRTEWEEAPFLPPSDLVHWLEEIADRLPGREKKWWLLGYSMGGRVALQLLQLIPEKIGKIILLAPDGLKMNRWYWLATQTGWGRRLFRHTMRRPGWLFGLLRVGRLLGTVNPGIYKFANRYLDDRQARQDLYTRWTALRGFRPDIPTIRAIIRSRGILIRLFYGRYDRIIRWETGRQFIKGLDKEARLVLLPVGHHLLQAGNLQQLLAGITR